jgi:hypothetical protein
VRPYHSLVWRTGPCTYSFRSSRFSLPLSGRTRTMTRTHSSRFAAKAKAAWPHAKMRHETFRTHASYLGGCLGFTHNCRCVKDLANNRCEERSSFQFKGLLFSSVQFSSTVAAVTYTEASECPHRDHYSYRLLHFVLCTTTIDLALLQASLSFEARACLHAICGTTNHEYSAYMGIRRFLSLLLPSLNLITRIRERKRRFPSMW